MGRRDKLTPQEKSEQMMGVDQELARLNAIERQNQIKVDSLKGQEKHFAESIESRRAELADLEAQCVFVSKKLADTQEALSKMGEEHGMALVQLSEKKALLEESSKQLRGMQMNIKVAKNELQHLSKQVESGKKKAEKEVKAYKASLLKEASSLEKDIKRLEQSVKDKSVEVAEKNQLLVGCNKKLSIMANNIKIEQERQRQLIESQADFENVKDKIIEENMELSLVTKKLDDIREQKKQLESEMVELQKEKESIIKERIAFVEQKKQLDRKARRIEGLYDKAGVKYGN